jgi:hypothetical protein
MFLELGHTKAQPSRIENLRKSFFSVKRFSFLLTPPGRAKAKANNTSANKGAALSQKRSAPEELLSVPVAKPQPIARD